MKEGRYFFALPVPQPVLDQSLKVQHALQTHSHGAKLRFIPQKNMHITLHFMGSLTHKKVLELCVAVNETICNCKALSFDITGTGYFSRDGKPSVLWMGVASTPPELQGLYNGVAALLDDQRITVDRRNFVPHLTLAYVKKGSAALNDYLRNEYQREVDRPVSYTCQELQLMKSELKPAGAEYSVVKSYALKG